MIKKIKQFVLITLIATGVFQSCSSDDSATGDTNNTMVTFQFTAPQGVEVIAYSELQVQLKELNTGFEKTDLLTKTNQWQGSIPQGTYQVAVEGKITYNLDGKVLEAAVSAFSSSEVVTGLQTDKNLNLVLKSTHTDLTVEEIFFTGTMTPEGKQYIGDRYFKIYNNTDKVLYADGLLIAESAFLTVEKQIYTPDIMSQAVAVGAIIMLPGTGNQYAVEPGKSIVIAEDAINHKEYNINSIDLRKADFEIYQQDADDVDNPEVANVIEAYSRFTIHNRGFKSYVIARLPAGMTLSTYLAANKYEYTYDLVFGGETYPMDNEAMAIPNEWIIDAVNLSIPSDFQWIVTSPALDMGWSYCGKVDKDKTRYGKSVRRKTITTNVAGHRILKDTNNSTLDFEAEAKASLIN
ncbi:DUF4876 domain-containing protein [Flavobacterium sp. HSC-61S13]|uniref:DUF4876 domain-containing protein n=1 Tax=Flavobacterium sp. HSC-61S13 TaxID=2910963 RepID=UPI0020A0094C|nr:DUF4876 domain-containing protein [Flavobacterium sp. HSC-61S13]MCP1996506.1 hypothetical protein [Flavobacterium sp. HSC-61S13]